MAKKQPFKNNNPQFAKAFNKGDAASIATLYSKDAIFMMPETPLYKGSKGVAAANQSLFDSGYGNVKFTTTRSGSDGDLAFNIGGVSMDQKTANGTVKVSGKYMDVYRRQKDGSWKIIATMYNPDGPVK